MKTDKCYSKKRVKERVYNTKTGRWKRTWVDLPSTTTTTQARSTDTTTRGLGPLYQPKLYEHNSEVIQLKEQTFVTDPVTKETTSWIQHHNIRVYTNESNEASFIAAAQPVSTQLLNTNGTDTSFIEQGIIPGPGIEPQNQKDSSYGDRRRRLAENWTTLKPVLETCFHNTQAPASLQCAMCDHVEQNILHCPDCGPMAYYCDRCSSKVHRLATLHIPVRWTGQEYVPHKWHKELELVNHHCHHQTVPGSVFLIDEKGREHLTSIHFCECQTKAETLMELGFWPSSPDRPNVGIDLRFMEKARCFLLEGTEALHTFCSCIKEYLQYLPTYSFHVDLYRVLTHDCTSQHRSFIYDVNHMKGIVDDFPDSSRCPVCTKTEDILPKIVSMDGNFRLVRKKSSGVSYIPPHHGSRLFIEKEEYQSYLTKQPSTSLAHDTACNDFRAGDTKRSTINQSKLDINGIFGSVCIHDYPQLFIDLEAGEKLGYAVCLVSQWKERPGGLKVMYDIACRIKPQLQRGGIDVHEIGLAVPVFHGYAHEIKCQVQYNPRLLEMYRNSDGENIERLWSYLGRFTYITKEMTSSNRRDLLVDALLHYGKRVLRNEGNRLKARMENAREINRRSDVQLESTKLALTDLGVTVSDDIIDVWSNYYKTPLQENASSAHGSSWKEEYATNLNSFFSLSSRLVEPPVQKAEIDLKVQVQELEAKLVSVEKMHKMKRWTSKSAKFKDHLQDAQRKKQEELLKKLHHEAVDRRHLILMKREARGHDRAAQISKQLRTTNTTIEKLVKKFNLLPNVNATSFETAKEFDSDLYQGMVVNTRFPGVPFYLMREAVITANRIQRCKEEIAALEIEMPALLDYLKEIHHLLEETLNCADISTGARACVLKRLCENEKEQQVTICAMKEAMPNKDFHCAADAAFLDQRKEIMQALSDCSDVYEVGDNMNGYSDHEDDYRSDDENSFASSEDEDD